MKRNLFFIINSISLLAIIGFGTQSCSDDDDDNPSVPEVVGTKIIELRVTDERGEPVTADVTIWENEDSIKTVNVAGSYAYDVSKEPTNSVFKFVAKRDGYISSETRTVTLTYTDASQNWYSYLMLIINKQSDTYIVDQTQNSTLRFASKNVPSRDITMMIPAGVTNTRFIHITPSVIATASSRGILLDDAPNGAPALEIVNIESDWSGDFENGKKVKFTFPLSEEAVRVIKENNLNLVFGTKDNAANIWETYPVTVDNNTFTASVEIPHFSKKWYLTIASSATFNTRITTQTLLGTTECSRGMTANFNQPNTNIPNQYKGLFGWETLESISRTHIVDAIPNMQTTVHGQCDEVNISFPGTSLPNYVYYQGPVVFITSAASCSHGGGGGQ